MKTREISGEEILRQKSICSEIRQMALEHGASPLAMVDTYGCQQNESDSDRLRGMLGDMGYGFTDDENAADIVIMNTCAVREHAEQRVFGNIGALTHTKRRNPNQRIIVCGCMAAEESAVEKLRSSYRHVDMVFSPHELWRFPELMLKLLTFGGRIYESLPSDGTIAEGISLYRTGGVRAWLPVMYGCDNFCSYCIVPYVRGRERSRKPEDVLGEARQLVQSGVKGITLLGQNVNSYGRGLDENVTFARLLREVCELPGEFIVDFMTSHPKDATEELFKVMSECANSGKHLHLPVQCGSDRVLAAMNRGYTMEEYLRLIELARGYMPELAVTTDVIVGYPGETEEDFQKTLELTERARFDAMFTFLYSKREGTPAAKLEDIVTREEKQERFDMLLELQNKISGEKHAALVGKTMRVLIDGNSADKGGGLEYNLTSRTYGGRLVHLKGEASLIGSFAEVRITDSRTWALFGELVSGGNPCSPLKDIGLA